MKKQLSDMEKIMDTNEIVSLPEEVEVIGVRFRQTGKVYYFDPVSFKIEQGENVIVETARGLEYGQVVAGNKFVPNTEIVPPLRRVVRKATKEDDEHHEENNQKEKEAFDICLQKIEKHNLDMKLIEVEYTFDNNKLLFYFSAEGRVDFRDLVKDLASVFKTRIELRQIGIRDEAKMMGGLGVCGRPFCCKTFLNDFAQVSIKMAKEQNLSLNSAKISGTCGRLMCCLRYESEVYEEELKLTPKVDSIVDTPDGEGVVAEISPLAGIVKVKMTANPDQPFKSFKREDVKVKGYIKKKEKNEKIDEDLKKLEDF